MKLIEARASQINKEVNTRLDPATLLIIIELLMEAVQLFKNCKKTPTEVVNELKEVRVYTRYRLRVLLKKKIKDADLRKKLFKPVLLVSTKLTQEEVEGLYSEVN